MAMVNEVRTVYFDQELRIEAYRFEGLRARFPNHFHDYYVFGTIESGQRYMRCKAQEYVINTGDMIILNPQDTHTCEQTETGHPLDYRCLNIKPEIMRKAVYDITGEDRLPHFTQQVLYHSELADCLRELHLMISENSTDFKKEELFLFFVAQLLRECSDAQVTTPEKEPTLEIKAVCDYLNLNYAKTITLDSLSFLSGYSKYHLLRSFTRQKGISPYSYLETIRIGRAKTLLEQGVPPGEAALLTGFSDQSHFSNFFKKLIGLTPKQYMRIFNDDTKTHWEDAQLEY